MSNSKEIKERMAGIRETMKITNAMYLISSSKMKQAKQKLAETEPFKDSLILAGNRRHLL